MTKSCNGWFLFGTLTDACRLSTLHTATCGVSPSPIPLRVKMQPKPSLCSMS